MAYDEALAERIRAYLRGHTRVSESRQFGGIGFLVRGNMAVGVIRSDMLVRVGAEEHEMAMKRPHVKPFTLTGRPASGWVLVTPAGLASAATLKYWIDLGVDFAKSLPPK